MKKKNNTPKPRKQKAQSVSSKQQKIKKYTKHYLLYSVMSAAVFIIVGSFFWKHTINTPPPVTPVITSQDIITNDIFAQVLLWSPAKWSFIQTASISSYYGTLIGKQIEAIITTQQSTISHFEDQAFLQNLGFDLDRNLSADGLGSSVWGYKKTIGSNSQVVLFSYTTTPVTVIPNEPLQFSCPCDTHITVFISSSFYK